MFGNLQPPHFGILASAQASENAAGGTRTPTRVAPQRILSPWRLPFRHGGAQIALCGHRRSKVNSRQSVQLCVATQLLMIFLLSAEPKLNVLQKILSSYAISCIPLCSPMNHPPSTTHSSPSSQAIGRSIPSAGRFLRSVFFFGPKQLFTSRISIKCAGFIAALCAPSLLCCSLLTIPAFLFQSPEQHAYYYFSQLINEDPTRWLVIFLATVCAILSLAVPAFMPPPRFSTDY